MMVSGIVEGIMRFGRMYIVEPIRNFGISDALDILILTVILYAVYMFVKGRRAAKLALGLVFILAFYALSDIFHFRAVYQLLSVIAPFGIVLLVVIFQPEIRDALEKLGSSPFGFWLSGNDQDRSNLMNTISEVVEAVCQIALTEEDGALIVMECSTPLGEYATKAQPLDAQVSANLLENIFVNRSPMHDGAVLIRNNRVAAAGCKLPLTTNEDVARGLGTRHRAAIGVTEVSDCVVVVVSEEKHIISVTNAGLIKRDYNRGIADLRSEESLKLIQNSLRQDLFLLLAGMPLDKSDGKDKGKSKGKGKRYSVKDASDGGKKAKGDKSNGSSKSAESASTARNSKTSGVSVTAKFSKGSATEAEGIDERDNRVDVIPTPAPDADTLVIIPKTKSEAATEGDRDTTEDA